MRLRYTADGTNMADGGRKEGGKRGPSIEGKRERGEREER